MGASGISAVAYVLAIPGVWLPPYIGAPLWGSIIGFGLVRLTRRMQSRRPPSGSSH